MKHEVFILVGGFLDVCVNRSGVSFLKTAEDDDICFFCVFLSMLLSGVVFEIASLVRTARDKCTNLQTLKE